MGYYEDKLERNRALLRALGHIEGNEEPPAEPENKGKVDFDGGARESAPLPSDPEEEHNRFLLELFENAPRGGGGEW